jgi:hypothetical protein
MTVFGAAHRFHFDDPGKADRLFLSSALIGIAFAVVGTFTNWLRDVDSFS